MAALFFESGGEGESKVNADEMARIMGPQQVDQFIRQAISTCWMFLPEGKRNVTGVETEIRRLVERALKDLKEDAAAFGVAKRE